MIDFDGTRKNLSIAEIVELAVTRGKELELKDEELYEYKQQISTLEDEVKMLEGKLRSADKELNNCSEAHAMKGLLNKVKCDGVGDNDGFFELNGEVK